MPALTDIAGEIFVADNELVIEQDTNKASVGLGVGANINLSNDVTERPTRTDDLIVGPVIDQREGTPARRLDVRAVGEAGWLVRRRDL